MEKVDPTVVIYRAFARKGKGCYCSAYPVHSIVVEHQKGKRALLRITFAVEHLFCKELCDFLQSIRTQLSQKGIRSISSKLDPYPTTLEKENLEVLTCVFLYSGSKNLGKKIKANQFIRELAAFLGSPSIELPAYVIPLTVLPAFEDAMALI